MDRRKAKHNNVDWKLFIIISFKESVGRNPPEEITVIVKFKLLKSLIPDIKKIEKINTVKDK